MVDLSIKELRQFRMLMRVHDNAAAVLLRATKDVRAKLRTAIGSIAYKTENDSALERGIAERK
jgi:hypothetical protein